MANINFEDYRQPWETGPHWELKREFIENYTDMFPEDRLLCLAQAYSNIVLMNCCYPDPVMRQISILSKPLEMRKRFQEISNSTETETPKNDHNKRVSEKLKSIYENSGRPFKQMKFCASAKETPISSIPSITNENAVNPSKNICYSTVHDQQTFQESLDSVSTVTNIDQSFIICDSQIKENVTQQTEEEKNILSTLGSEFIQKFIQFVRNNQARGNSPVEAISYAVQKLQITQQLRYDISLVPGSRAHPPVYSSKMFLNDCLISTETGLNKKKAKIKSAEAAIDVLIKLSSTGSNTAPEANNESLNSQTVSCLKASPSIANENPLNLSKNTCYSTVHDQQNFQQSCDSVSTVTNIDQSPTICDSQIKGNVTPQTEEEKNILSTLGSEFIQNFIQFVRKNVRIGNSPVEAISYAVQKLKITQQLRYDISLVPGSSAHSPVYSSKMFLNDCLISTETGLNKKKAKIKSAEAAIDVLIKLTSTRSNTASETNNESLNNQTVSCVKELTHVGEKANNSIKLLHELSEKILNRTKEQSVVISFKHITESLNVQSYIGFDVLPVLDSSVNSNYICKLFVRNILISSGKHTNIDEAKRLAVESGFTKLENILKYEIQSGKLVEKLISSVDTFSDLTTKYSNIESQKNQCGSFILNKDMLNSSLRDGFVLVHNLRLNVETSRNLRTLLPESASFCHKSFEYKVEDVIGIEPPSKKTYVVIGEEIIGTGIASSKEESKTFACEDAYEMLKRKYYTLKVKNEYIDGYIISRKQVFEGESFSSGALTDSNIGCKMLKSMGWTGGGLGTSGILEPVEAHGYHSFGRGLGFGNDLGDVQLFKKRIESMLHDYSRTNTLSDLVFSKEFSKDERKEIHRIAGKFHLHTASRGVNENRFLTVRHKYNVTQVLRYLVNHKGSNSKFELIDASEMPLEL